MAITYGMSLKEFWEDDPNLFWAYRYSYIDRMKFNSDMLNEEAWLQGAYVYEAVSIALNNGFIKRKLEYSKHPYGYENKLNEKKQKELLEIEVADIKMRINEINSLRVALSKRDKPEEVYE